MRTKAWFECVVLGLPGEVDRSMCWWTSRCEHRFFFQSPFCAIALGSASHTEMQHPHSVQRAPHTPFSPSLLSAHHGCFHTQPSPPLTLCTRSVSHHTIIITLLICK